MKTIIENMIATIVAAEDRNVSQAVIEDMVINLKDLLRTFEITINCPSNWRDLRYELQEEYQDDQYILDILSEY